MKLKNKILAIAAPCAAIATVAPVTMLTGCSKKTSSNYLEVDASKFDQFVPTNPQIPLCQMTASDLATRYFKDIKETQSILLEDIVFFIQMAMQGTPATGHVKAWVNNIDAENKRLSIKYDVSLTYSTADASTITIKCELVNIPFKFQFDSYTGTKMVPTWENVDAAKADTADWRAKIYFDGASNSGIDVDVDKTGSDDDIQVALDYLNQQGLVCYHTLLVIEKE